MASAADWGLASGGPFAGSDDWGGGGLFSGVSGADWISAGSKVLGSALSPSSAPSMATAPSVIHSPMDASGWIVGTGGASLSGNTTRGGGVTTGATPLSFSGEQPFMSGSLGGLLPILLVIGVAWAAAKAL